MSRHVARAGKYACLTISQPLANGKLITKVSLGTKADVDTAVKLAHKALETTWGLNAGGAQRAAMLRKLGDLMYDHREELAAIEALDNGAPFTMGAPRRLTRSV